MDDPAAHRAYSRATRGEVKPPTRWRHNGCGGVVVFDLSGGFCTQCHAENLEVPDDVAAESIEGDEPS